LRAGWLALALAACTSPIAAADPADPPPSSGSESVPARAGALDPANATLANLCIIGEGTLDVRDGVASYESGLGEGLEGSVELTTLARADLDGDGAEEIVIHVTCMPGGSGHPDAVWALDASLAPIAHIEGGDRADGGLEGGHVEDGAVIVGRYSGDEEGLCCPTHVTDETWRLLDGAFVRTAVGETRPVDR
jgi:hypothetical protein